jgi:predicted alpha/beta superfamily hydrolase
MSSPHALVTLPDTEVRLLKSSLVHDTYRLLVALPINYAISDKTYPVVYLTYGNLLIPVLWFIAQSLSVDWELPRLIVVGIGYDTDKPIELARIRERDFLPTSVTSPEKLQRQRLIPAGPGNKFLRFIREELKPFINANYRTNPDDSTYVGHSHGGLFGLYALFHHPDTFNRYVIGSPSIHHDNEVILTYERHYAANHDDLPARVFMSVGEREELDDPLINASFQFVTNVKKLAKTLQERNYPSLQLTTHVFEDETHASVMPVTFSRGLRVVFE